MPKKKSADQPVSSSPVSAPQPSAPPPGISRARGSSAKTVTHKHKLNASMPEAAVAEIELAGPPRAAAPVRVPSHEEISVRAYLIGEARGFQGGSPEDDWFRAERELLGERQ